MKKFQKIILINLLFIFLGLEIGLRITGITKVHSERVGFWYRSYWNHTKDSWFHTWKSDHDFVQKEKEFKFEYDINSLGIREVEFEKTKPHNVRRIMCLGDSFTEGNGASYNETYPRHLEQSLKSKCPNKKIEVLNVGVSGSDLLFSEKLLTEKLIHYDPDALLVNINASDVTDIIQRGGEERFRNDGTSVYRRGPWYHNLYKISHVVRLVVHTVFGKDKVFVGKQQETEVHKKSCKIIDKSIKKIRSFCDQHDIDVVFFLTPLLSEYNLKVYPDRVHDDGSADKFLRENFKLQHLESLDNEDVINLYTPLMDTLSKLKYEKYAWPINTHFNGYGYALMAEYVEQAVVTRQPHFFCNKSILKN